MSGGSFQHRRKYKCDRIHRFLPKPFNYNRWLCICMAYWMHVKEVVSKLFSNKVYLINNTDILTELQTQMWPNSPFSPTPFNPDYHNADLISIGCCIRMDGFFVCIVIVVVVILSFDHVESSFLLNHSGYVIDSSILNFPTGSVISSCHISTTWLFGSWIGSIRTVIHSLNLVLILFDFNVRNIKS